MPTLHQTLVGRERASERERERDSERERERDSEIERQTATEDYGSPILRPPRVP